MRVKYQQLLKICLMAQLYLVLVGADELENQSIASVENEVDTLNATRINGGQVMNEPVPFQVSMQMRRRGNRWIHFCSGSIISQQHVLTAAHCVDKLKASDISVLGGTLNWKAGGHRHYVVAKHVHPQYTPSSQIINDIALLQVSPPFKLQLAEIGTVHLGDSAPIGRQVPVRVTGWGSTTPTSAGATVPDQLQVLNYQTISNEECVRKGFRVTANEICAFSAPGQGSCYGDSGGPLTMTRGGGRQQQLVGVVSYGGATCAQGKPDVYTRVSRFLPYINKILDQDLKNA
ncbi:chymotrypsin-2 [Drosophila grimshawi]|uniref:trypsin n=1 Tax=Drosophila grimshawi TaxID=7222 RepID=B4JUM8_DROGR|nr:chymotrypsin-2 [Drosophila grimshawi]EDV91198.1 GH17316 [Drosophila grimshawi]